MTQRVQRLGNLDWVLFGILRTRWIDGPSNAIPTVACSPREFVDFVSIHGLTGVLLRYHSKLIASKLGTGILHELHAAHMLAARQNQRNITCVLLLAELFSQAEIDWALLKGVALSLQLYDDPNVRMGGDVDVLVNDRDIDRVVALLAAAGFTDIEAFPKKGPLRRWMSGLMTHQRTLLSPQGAVVELHWRSDYSPGLSLGSLNDLKSKVMFKPFGRLDIPCLDSGLLVSQVARHAYRSMWLRWKWLYDVVEVSGQLEAKAARSPPKTELEPALDMSLSLAEFVLGLSAGRLGSSATVPTQVAAHILCLRDSKIGKELREVALPPVGIGRMHGEAGLAIQRLWFQAKAHGGWGASIRYLLWRTMVPLMTWLAKR